MAHPAHVKAQAMGMLILGNTVGYVSRTLRVPKQTVSQWNADADVFIRELVDASPELRAVVAMIRQMLPGLRKNGIKKRKPDAGQVDTIKKARNLRKPKIWLTQVGT